MAIKTSLGWVLSGPIRGKKLSSNSDNVVALVIDPHPLSKQDTQDVNKNVHKLSDLDSIGIREENDVHQEVKD